MNLRSGQLVVRLELDWDTGANILVGAFSAVNVLLREL